MPSTTAAHPTLGLTFSSPWWLRARLVWHCHPAEGSTGPDSDHTPSVRGGLPANTTPRPSLMVRGAHRQASQALLLMEGDGFCNSIPHPARTWDLATDHDDGRLITSVLRTKAECTTWIANGVAAHPLDPHDRNAPSARTKQLGLTPDFTLLISNLTELRSG